MTAIFPSSLLCFGIGVKRSAVWSTLVQTSVSGKETRAAFQSTPRWRYEIPVPFARISGFSVQTVTNEMATLQAFFQAAQGQLNYFLYTDPFSNTAVAQNIGTGTGGAGQTTQIDDIEGFPIFDFNGTPALYVNGVLKTLTTDYTVSATGLVTWVTNPGNTLPITWSGSYYRRCRFETDEWEMEQIVNLVWGNASLKLISVK